MIAKRNYIVCVLLTFCTCGVFGIYWFIKLTDELNYLSEDESSHSGSLAFILLICTCGMYGFYWAYMQGKKIDIIKGTLDESLSGTGLVYVVLGVVSCSLIPMVIIQDEINNILSEIE